MLKCLSSAADKSINCRKLVCQLTGYEALGKNRAGSKTGQVQTGETGNSLFVSEDWAGSDK